MGTGFHPELTGRENIYLNGAILGMKRSEIERKFDEIVAFSEVEKFIDTPVKRYSSGMYLRLAFAVAAHLEPEILVVDEVLAVGDAEFQRKCLGKMSDVAQEGRTVLFVSHNMSAILRLTEEAIVLDKGQLVAARRHARRGGLLPVLRLRPDRRAHLGGRRNPGRMLLLSAPSRCGCCDAQRRDGGHRALDRAGDASRSNTRLERADHRAARGRVPDDHARRIGLHLLRHR